MATTARVQGSSLSRVRRAARRPLVLVLVALVGIAAFLLVRGARHRSGAHEVMAVPVERRDISLTIEATGTVEPIDLVEVKSKASGQIVTMPVQVGSVVRRDDLFASQVITADEHESATLDYANAQAALVKARTDLDLARQRREDATVRAPITGTILEQPVSTGTVISSATSSASGGT